MRWQACKRSIMNHIEITCLRQAQELRKSDWLACPLAIVHNSSRALLLDIQWIVNELQWHTLYITLRCREILTTSRASGLWLPLMISGAPACTEPHHCLFEGCFKGCLLVICWKCWKVTKKIQEITLLRGLPRHYLDLPTVAEIFQDSRNKPDL